MPAGQPSHDQRLWGLHAGQIATALDYPPVEMMADTAPVAVVITDTVPSPLLATSARGSHQAAIATPSGVLPTGMGYDSAPIPSISFGLSRSVGTLISTTVASPLLLT